MTAANSNYFKNYLQLKEHIPIAQFNIITGIITGFLCLDMKQKALPPLQNVLIRDQGIPLFYQDMVTQSMNIHMI